MRLLVITSCTGEKSVSDTDQLTLDDFRQGLEHINTREQSFSELLTPAEQLYTGMQHERLMQGVNEVRLAKKFDLDLWILSAGYGLVPADRKLAPYEATFIGMKKAESRAWAEQLSIAKDVRQVISQPYDLGLILLGDDYLDACAFDNSLVLGGSTIVFCGKNAAKKLPNVENLIPVTLSNAEAKRFSCALIGLKGELASRLLRKVIADLTGVSKLILAKDKLLDLIEAPSSSNLKPVKQAARANPNVDRVIELPDSWRNKPHRQKLSYFIPEWDDQVDPDFDFETDTHSGGMGDWSNQVYAHQMYSEPNYDGILISKVVAEKSKKKAERINRLGVHRYLRVPRDFPIMGDCGAFGYINHEVPPYTTDEILDYYSRLDFDYGVSIDHFAIGSDEQKKARYDLTIQNAEDFLREHQRLGLSWTPIGAVQGWDADSYVRAARQYVAMGYKYIGLGAMVPRKTEDILLITEAVRKQIPADVKVHLFGVARMQALRQYVRINVNSVDSATYLRQAWMRTKDSFLLHDGSTYAAIRIPEAGKSFRAKRMADHAELDEQRVIEMEKEALHSLRGFAKHDVSLDNCLNALLEYDRFVTQQRLDMEPLYRRTLLERPWERCGCPICKTSGIEVVIFRGNNRNRRRGFHNTHAFYQMFSAIVEGRMLPPGLLEDDVEQTNLDFEPEQAA
jgi:hypothetical protein